MKSSDFKELFEKAEGIVKLLEGISSRFPNFQYRPEFSFFPDQKKIDLFVYLDITYAASNGKQELEVTTRAGHSQLTAAISEDEAPVSGAEKPVNEAEEQFSEDEEPLSEDGMPLISSEVQEQINCREEKTELSDRIAEVLAANGTVIGKDYILNFEDLDVMKFDRKPHSFRGWTGGYMAYPDFYGQNKLLNPEMDLAMEWQAGNQFANIITRILSLRKLYDLLLENLQKFNLQEKKPELKDRAYINMFKQMIDSDFCNSFLSYKQELNSLLGLDFVPELKSSGAMTFDSKEHVEMDRFPCNIANFRIAKDFESKDKFNAQLLIYHQFPSAETFEKAKNAISQYGLGEEHEGIVRGYKYTGLEFQVIRRERDNFFVIEFEKAMEDKNALFNEMKKINPVMIEFYTLIK